MVRFAYLVELVSITAFFYNAVIILATLLAGLQRPGLQWWFLSLITITMGLPLSWWLFYKSIFNSAQTDGATYSYIRTFMLILLHMVSTGQRAAGRGGICKTAALLGCHKHRSS